MHQVKEVYIRDGFKLHLTFSDGAQGVVDLSALAGKGVFTRWNERAFFESVEIGELGELRWGDDIDLCPDALYMEATGSRPEDVFPALKREGANA